MNSVIKVLLIIMGTLFIVVGVLGIFLPLLPTTPFLLLGASCYIRGSERLYNWLIHNKILGTYIRNYREKKGIPLKSKIIGISMLWATMLFTVFFVVPILFVKVLLLAVASGVTWHIASQKTLTAEVDEPAEQLEKKKEQSEPYDESQGVVYEE